MNLFDLFKSAPSISPDEVREYIKDRSPDEYCLLDVRQPTEYEQGHLPGARLIPVSDLSLKLRDMDPQRTTIVYCRTGNRSLSAASLLMSAGFKNILNMEGGIIRYNGITASGPLEAGMFCFPESLSPGQLTAVAWFLEDGTITFLERILTNPVSNEIDTLMKELITEKKAHKDTLEKLYTDLTGQSPSAGFPGDVLDVPDEGIMIGCIKVSTALQWAAGKEISEVLELMISFAANAYDLYLKLGRAVASDEARRVFTVLYGEELRRIQRISSVYESMLRK